MKYANRYSRVFRSHGPEFGALLLTRPLVPYFNASRGPEFEVQAICQWVQALRLLREKVRVHLPDIFNIVPVNESMNKVYFSLNKTGRLL